jgi:hypothetical protein
MLNRGDRRDVKGRNGWTLDRLGPIRLALLDPVLKMRACSFHFPHNIIFSINGPRT